MLSIPDFQFTVLDFNTEPQFTVPNFNVPFVFEILNGKLKCSDNYGKLKRLDGKLKITG